MEVASAAVVPVPSTETVSSSDKEVQKQQSEEDVSESDSEEDLTIVEEEDEGDLIHPPLTKGPDTVMCENCGLYVYKSHLASHESLSCSNATSEGCPFAEEPFKCGAREYLTRKQLAAHVHRNIANHVAWLIETVQRQAGSIETLQKQITEERKQREELQNELAQLKTKGISIPVATSESNTFTNLASPNRNATTNTSALRTGRIFATPSPVTGRQSRAQVEAAVSSSRFEALLNSPLGQGISTVLPDLPVRTVTQTTGRYRPPSPEIMGQSPFAAASQIQKTIKRDDEVKRQPPPPQPSEPPVQPLVRSENAWRPGKAKAVAGVATTTAAAAAAPTSELDEKIAALNKSLKSVLNKLTAANYEKLSNQVLDILRDVTDEKVLSSLVILFFDKAVTDTFFASLYSTLCKKVSDELPPLNGDAKKGFRYFLLNQCQNEFEAGTSVSSSTSSDSEEEHNKKKRRLLGTIRFIGQLYIKGLVVSVILRHCFDHLLPVLKKFNANTSSSDGDNQQNTIYEDEIECLCKLMMTTGEKFDVPANEALMKNYISQMKEAEENKAIPSRLRFMLHDVRDMRQQGWKLRESQKEQSATESTATPISSLSSSSAPSLLGNYHSNNQHQNYYQQNHHNHHNHHHNHQNHHHGHSNNYQRR